MKDVVKLCKHCGYMVVALDTREKCVACGNDWITVTENVIPFLNMDKEETDEYRQVLLGDKIIPPEMVAKRLEYQAMKSAEVRSIPTSNTTNEVKCPYCSSTSVKKIGASGRLFSTLMFGLGGSKIGKQWHCKTCNSDF